MGGGSYSYIASSSRGAAYKKSSVDQTFSSTKLDDEMNICGKIRESRDSSEHPESFPIIIGLDETGSMSSIPYYLITEAFPDIMKRILEEGVKDPQVCFLGIGDFHYDDAPIQAGQFETSDLLLDKWLRKVYLEGGGGGNAGEDYHLAWYFAARHTVTDSYTKRGKKGILITIGDESCNPDLDQTTILRQFGDTTKSTTSKEILEEARKSWNVIHINITHGYSSENVKASKFWEMLMGDDGVIHTDSKNKIGEIISDVILRSYSNTLDDLDLPDDVGALIDIVNDSL
jgi:hypothetical protein